MILYEDKEILVCHKPAGIPVQSASVREKDLVSILRNDLISADVYVVHRLDQPVEGVLVFAKTKRAASDLSRQVSDGSMRKRYHAVAEVLPEWKLPDEIPESGEHVLIDYLVKDGRNNHSYVVTADHKNAKRAELKYRVLAIRKAENQRSSSRRYALVEIDLMTGRHHQIRVQMAHAGLPLAGDRKYNPDCFIEKPDRRSAAEVQYAGNRSASLALCAVSLTFRHPVTKERLIYEVKPTAEIFSGFSGVQTAAEV